MLRYLRRRARLTQADLGVAVGYSDAQICRLETGRRPPDLTTLIALFFPALEVDPQSELAQRLLALAAAARVDQEPVAISAPPAPTAAPPSSDAPGLPHPTTALIGRGGERVAIGERLVGGGARLLTLIGPPGIGKTRLALQAAHDLGRHFDDGARFVDLSAVVDVAEVPSALAQALGLSEEGHASVQAALSALLQPMEMLLVVDNVEQVVEAAPLLQALLEAAPRLALLVTSRVALRLAAEHILTLGPLPVPDLERLPAPQALAQVESVALLLARLRAHTPQLELTEQNALPLAAICVRVDGIPLAIELVAANGRLFTPHALLREVAQHFLRLRRRGRDIPSRHQTLQTALDWSYDRLPGGARELLLRLGVFAAGWTLEGALAVCDLDGAGREALLEQLETLLDHSLIHRQASGERLRMTMLAMVQEYARAHLPQDELEMLSGHLLRHLVELAEEVVHRLNYGAEGAEQVAWVTRMAAEQDNMRAALSWALASRQYELGLRLAAAAGRFWYTRGLIREGQRWVEAMLDASSRAGQQLDTPERARTLDVAGMLAWRQGQYAEAEQRYQEALAILQRAQRPADIARVQMHMGLTAFDRGELAGAVRWYEESLRYYRAVGDRANGAMVLHNLGNLYCVQNDNARALELFEECLEIYEERGDHSGTALLLLGMGSIARNQQDTQRAQAILTRSYELARELGDDWTAATTLMNFGELAADRGELAEARRWMQESLECLRRLDDPQSLSQCEARLGAVELLDGHLPAALELLRRSLTRASAIGNLACIAEGLEGLAACVAAGQPSQAAQLLGCAAALREGIRMPVALADLGRHERTLALVRQAAGQHWDAAWSAGQQLSAEQAVALALQLGAGSSPCDRRDMNAHSGLSPS
jgi:predicted ATPase